MRYDFTALTNIAPFQTDRGRDGSLRALRVRVTGGYEQGDPLARAYEGTIEAESIHDVPEHVFVLLNRDDRPNAKQSPSLSVGDVVVVHSPDGDIAYKCEPVGFEILRPIPDYENLDDYLDSVEAFRNA